VVENGPKLLALLNRFEIMFDSKGDEEELDDDTRPFE